MYGIGISSAEDFSLSVSFLSLTLARSQVVDATSVMMAGLTRALALLAIGGVVQASPCKSPLQLLIQSFF